MAVMSAGDSGRGSDEPRPGLPRQRSRATPRTKDNRVERSLRMRPVPEGVAKILIVATTPELGNPRMFQHVRECVVNCGQLPIWLQSALDSRSDSTHQVPDAIVHILKPRVSRHTGSIGWTLRCRHHDAIGPGRTALDTIPRFERGMCHC